MSVTLEQRQDGANRTLLAALIATVVMLFTGFAAAYIERSSNVEIWEKISLPPVLGVNTVLLIVSSLALWRARLSIAIGFGALFLIGQVWAWFELRDQGITAASNAHAAFFYILSVLHALHVIGGLIALLVSIRQPRIRRFAAGFWHLMGVMWVYVLGVLVIL